MALDREIFQGGYRDGTILAASGQLYYGGSPLAVGSLGLLVLATSGTSLNYIGVSANSSTVDGVGTTVNAQASVYVGPLRCVLKVESDLVTYPYDNTLTWLKGDKLYINQAGKWANTKFGTQTSKGVVILPGAGQLLVAFGVNYE